MRDWAAVLNRCIVPLSLLCPLSKTHGRPDHTMESRQEHSLGWEEQTVWIFASQVAQHWSYVIQCGKNKG